MREITLQDACRNKTENHDDIQTDPTRLKQLDETLNQNKEDGIEKTKLISRKTRIFEKESKLLWLS